MNVLKPLLSSTDTNLHNELSKLSLNEGKQEVESESQIQKPIALSAHLQTSVRSNNLQLSISDDSLKKISQFVLTNLEIWTNSNDDIVLNKDATKLDLDMIWDKKTKSLLIEEIALFEAEGAQKKVFIWINSDGVLLASCTTDFNKNPKSSKHEIQKKLELEEEILKDLKGHNCIIKYYSTIMKINSISILSEYCDLRDYVQYLASLNHGVIESNKLQIINDVLQGLAYLQEKRIVHRDIKLDNIFITTNKSTPNGIRARIGDFGFALYVDRINDNSPFTLCGTPEYLPPDPFIIHPNFQRTLHKTYFSQIDIWSFGISVFGIHIGSFPQWSYKLKTSTDIYNTISMDHKHEIRRLKSHVSESKSSRRMSTISRKLSQFTLLLLQKLPELTETDAGNLQFNINRPDAKEALAKFTRIFKDELILIDT